jgi:type II secretory pathway predicted ATPase ExeA
MNHAINIYLDHFGLNERPFSLVPDPDFLFWSPAHKRAYAMLEYGIVTRAPITLITGDVGAGKTTLLHHLLKSMDGDVQVGLVSNAHGTRDELLRWVLQSLDQPFPQDADYVALFGQFEQYLVACYSAGRRVVMIFDEAQNLSPASLEELRMLTNINANKDELLQLVLVGQPELRAIVRRPELTQFAQRVAASFHLPALDADMVIEYVDHRLNVAGAREPIFTAGACNIICTVTKGVPRLINQLCDLSLLYAYTDEKLAVSEAIVDQVLKDGVFFAGGVDQDDLEEEVFRSRNVVK